MIALRVLRNRPACQKRKDICGRGAGADPAGLYRGARQHKQQTDTVGPSDWTPKERKRTPTRHPNRTSHRRTASRAWCAETPRADVSKVSAPCPLPVPRKRPAAHVDTPCRTVAPGTRSLPRLASLSASDSATTPHREASTSGLQSAPIPMRAAASLGPCAPLRRQRVDRASVQSDLQCGRGARHGPHPHRRL